MDETSDEMKDVIQTDVLQSSKGWIAKRSKSNMNASLLSIVPPEEGPPVFNLSESGRFI